MNKRAALRDDDVDEARFANLKLLSLSDEAEAAAASSPLRAGTPRRVPGWLIGVAAGLLATEGANLLLHHATPDRPKIVQSGESTAAAPATTGLSAAGYVVARRQATVAAEVTGRVATLPVREGEQVRRGMVLATLDPSSVLSEATAARADQAAAAAALQSVGAQADDAGSTFTRTEQIAARGFATRATVSSDRARMLSLQAQVAQARSAYLAAGNRAERWRQEVRKYTIRAPFDGVIIGLNAQVGEIISPASAGGGFTRTGICTLVDMTSLELEVDVSEGYISRVHEGARATAVLDAYPGVAFPARVVAIIPAANRDKATVTVRLALDRSDPRVLPNMAVKVNFPA